MHNISGSLNRDQVVEYSDRSSVRYDGAWKSMFSKDTFQEKYGSDGCLGSIGAGGSVRSVKLEASRRVRPIVTSFAVLTDNHERDVPTIVHSTDWLAAIDC